MIYEYAIHPEFILEIGDKNDLLLSLYRNIGIGTPCIISDYPKDAAKIVRTHIEAKLREAKEPKEKARWQRMQSNTTEIMKKLWFSVVIRHGAPAWSETFEIEHARHPFQGILVPSNQCSNSSHRNLSWLRSENCEIFSSPLARCVRRTALDLGKVLKPLLQNASEITFVDPYFGPEERFKNAYKEYFTIIAKARHIRCAGSTKINIICICNNSPKRTVPHEEFKSSCDEFSRNVLQSGIEINIYRVKELDGEQEFHNRYILTNIGGVTFGHGTDESYNSKNSFDNISILPREVFNHWKSVYTPGSSDFDWPKAPVHLEMPAIDALAD